MSNPIVSDREKLEALLYWLGEDVKQLGHKTYTTGRVFIFNDDDTLDRIAEVLPNGRYLYPKIVTKAST